MKEQDEIRKLLELVDGSGSDKEYDAIHKLKEKSDELPSLLLEKYKSARRAKERGACLYYSLRYAKQHQEAFDLAKMALKDRAKHPRYLACMLLALSLRKEAITELKNVAQFCTDEDTLGDIAAAIDSIENNNSNFFADRDHSGLVTLNLE